MNLNVKKFNPQKIKKLFLYLIVDYIFYSDKLYWGKSYFNRDSYIILASRCMGFNHRLISLATEFWILSSCRWMRSTYLQNWSCKLNSRFLLALQSFLSNGNKFSGLRSHRVSSSNMAIEVLNLWSSCFFQFSKPRRAQWTRANSKYLSHSWPYYNRSIPKWTILVHVRS